MKWKCAPCHNGFISGSLGNMHPIKKCIAWMPCKSFWEEVFVECMSVNKNQFSEVALIPLPGVYYFPLEKHSYYHFCPWMELDGPLQRFTVFRRSVNCCSLIANDYNVERLKAFLRPRPLNINRWKNPPDYEMQKIILVWFRCRRDWHLAAVNKLLPE